MRRFLFQPFETAYGLGCLVIAIVLFGSGLTANVSVVQALPLPLVVAWAAFLLTGGICILSGLVGRWPPRIGYGVERAGLCLTGSAWTIYVVMLIVLGSSSSRPILAWAVSSIFVIGSLGRLAFMYAEERRW